MVEKKRGFTGLFNAVHIIENVLFIAEIFVIWQIGHRIGMRYLFPESRAACRTDGLDEGTIIKIGALGKGNNAAAFHHPAKFGKQFSFSLRSVQAARLIYASFLIILHEFIYRC